MKLTKYTHSCVRLESGNSAIVIDPGMFSETETALAGADAVLITHEHTDHLDDDALRAAARANPSLTIWAPGPVVESLPDLADRMTTVEADQQYDIAGVGVRTFGGQHALIHPLIPVVANIAYLLDGSVLHPGDSFTVPPVAVQTLLLPLHAPWSKVAEVLDYAVAVRAPQIFQIHDSLLTETGRSVLTPHLQRITAPFGCEYTYLAPERTVTV
jgi:L-ascorbate metabolism protein UlaG (beta-lactamase superfamily)